MQQHLPRLFDAALDAVIGINADDVVTAWNTQAELVFGWRRDEALGRALAPLIIPHRMRAAHDAGLAHYLRTGEGPVLNRRIEVTGLRRTGQEFPVELTIIPIEEGATSFFAFLRDISERKEAERRLAQRAAEAELLWEASSLVAAGGSFDDLMRVCLQRICRIGGWQVGHVYTPDDPLNPLALLPSSTWHVESAAHAGIPAATGHVKFRRGEGLPGRVWASGSPQWIADLDKDPDVPRRDALKSAGLTAGFAFPICFKREVRAVLEFFAAERREPDEHLVLIVRSLGEQLARVLERQQAELQREALVHELRHRVNNSITVIRSLFRKSCEHAGSLAELRDVFEERLKGLGIAHNALAAGDWQSGDMGDVAHAALAPYCGGDHGSECQIEGPKVALPPAQVMSLSLVLHELATNATKYGALTAAGGRLLVSWVIQEPGRALRLNWTERGGPRVEPPQRRGFGSFLLTAMIERSHNGRVEVDYDPAGVKVMVELPLT